MAAERLTFDPDGDLLLRLTYTAGKEDTQNKTTVSSGGSEGNAQPSPYTMFYAHMNDGQSADEEQEVIKDVEMLVSAKHLMLASPVFKAMFKHSFVEGETLRSAGKVEVPLPDDDTTAMEIILNIIHGRVRQVPKDVTLDVMTAISILADKYQMHEVVELYVELWMALLKPSLPNYHTRDLYKWLSVAWVFKLPDQFRHLTWIAIRENFGDSFLQVSPDPSFPIPEVVLVEIEKQRRKAISDTLSIITQLRDRLTAPSPGTLFARPETVRVCTSTFGNVDIDNKRYNCEGMILGTLLKGLSDKRLWPPPENPYPGFAFKSLALYIRSLKITSLCDTMQGTSKAPVAAGFGFSSGNMQHQAHGQLKWMHDQVDRIESLVTGLTLEDFKGKLKSKPT